MKNFKIIGFSLLLILLGFSSCRNESIDASMPQTTVSGKKLAFDPKPQKHDDVYAKLRDFKEKLRLFQGNASLRSIQTMSVDKVVWNVEAYLNAAYGHSDKPFAGQSIHQDSFLISIADGEVSGSEVLSTLERAKGYVADQYRRVAESSKHIVFIDIAAKEIGGNQLQFKVSSFIGLNPLQMRTDPYSATDDWIYGFQLGKCDETMVGKDGTDRLNEELNTRYIVPPTVFNPHHMFFTDIEDIWILSNQFTNFADDTPSDNKRDYLLFVSNPNISTNYDDCILYQDMNWYYNNLYNIVTSSTLPNGIKPAGKYFVASNIWGDAIEIGNNRGPYRMQRGPISFGIPHFCWVSSPCNPTINCYIICDGENVN